MQDLAQDLVVSFASSGARFKDVSGQARHEFLQGAHSLRLGVVADSQLLIVAEDSHEAGQTSCPKTFHHLQNTLGGQAVLMRSTCHAQRHQDSPSELEDVESAYKRCGCSSSTAVPVIADDQSLGVLLLGLPNGQEITSQHLGTLAKLAGALAPVLQDFLSKATAIQDTSVFLEDTVAQCLYGCTCGGACTAALEGGSSSSSEFADFDMTPYEGCFDLNRKSFDEDTAIMEPCCSLESTCSESEALRSHLYISEA